jgi:hypothetical protein
MNRDAAIVLAQPLPPSYLFLPGSDMVMAAASDTAPSPPCPPGTVPRPRPEGTRRHILSSAARPRPGLKECGVQGRGAFSSGPGNHGGTGHGTTRISSVAGEALCLRHRA